MVKIINGLMYSTDTAELVASYSNGYGYNDFKYLEEELYRKRTGEYFLHGEGGPLTQYAEPCGDMVSGGERIIPLSVDGAREWAERHCSGDKYEEIFGPVPEDDSTRTISAVISSSSYSKLKDLAAAAKTSMSAVVDRLIREA